MTAHIVYTAIDDAAPATFSPTVIDEVIRGEIGFDGVLISRRPLDGALAGSFGERARRALDAGCDLVLHCNGDVGEMEEIAAAAPGRCRRAAAGAARARRGDAPALGGRTSTARAAERALRRIDGRADLNAGSNAA